MANIAAPIEELLGGEKPDFVAHAKRATPLGGSIMMLFFAIVWLTISGFMTYIFVTQLFSGGEIHYELNGEPRTATKPGLILLFPALFDLIGLFLLWISLRGIFGGDAWFAGTPNRLVIYTKGGSRSIDWDQFNGDVAVSGNENLGNVNLAMRTGHYKSQKNRPERYVPDEIGMIQIERPYQIESLCRARIKEHDPTPTNTNPNASI
ncbi:MAG: hypothetical protein AAB468_00865 [Patescibacteria group bacterium]